MARTPTVRGSLKLATIFTDGSENNTTNSTPLSRSRSATSSSVSVSSVTTVDPEAALDIEGAPRQSHRLTAGSITPTKIESAMPRQNPALPNIALEDPRRASARARKLTTKAQEMSSGKLSRPTRRRNSQDSRKSTDMDMEFDDSEDLDLNPPAKTTHATTPTASTTRLPRKAKMAASAPADIDDESIDDSEDDLPERNTKRALRRERKPSVRAREADTYVRPQRRARSLPKWEEITDEEDEEQPRTNVKQVTDQTPKEKQLPLWEPSASTSSPKLPPSSSKNTSPRKVVTLKLNAPKVPSKLRLSLSSTNGTKPSPQAPEKSATKTKATFSEELNDTPPSRQKAASAAGTQSANGRSTPSNKTQRHLRNAEPQVESLIEASEPKRRPERVKEPTINDQPKTKGKRNSQSVATPVDEQLHPISLYSMSTTAVPEQLFPVAGQGNDVTTGSATKQQNQDSGPKTASQKPKKKRSSNSSRQSTGAHAYPLHPPQWSFYPPPPPPPPACELFCLDPASRILAFATIAAESSDSEDEDENVSSPEYYEKWLAVGRARFCVCQQHSHGHASATPTLPTNRNPALKLDGKADAPQSIQNEDLAEVLPENTVLPFSIPPVNSTMPVAKSRKVSAFYTIISDHRTPRFGRYAQTMPASPASMGTTAGPTGLPMNHSAPATPVGSVRAPSTAYPNEMPPPAGSYEEKMRLDFQVLTALREEARNQGLIVTFNMSQGQIRKLLKEHYARTGAPFSHRDHSHGHGMIFPPIHSERQQVEANGTEEVEFIEEPVEETPPPPPAARTRGPVPDEGDDRLLDIIGASVRATLEKNSSPQKPSGSRPGSSNGNTMRSESPDMTPGYSVSEGKRRADDYEDRSGGRRKRQRLSRNGSARPMSGEIIVLD